MYGGPTPLVALGEDMKLETRVVVSLPYLGTDRRRENFKSEFLGQLDSAHVPASGLG